MKDCHVTETSATDPAFSGRVEDLIRNTEFGAKDVAPTTVSQFRIEFAPL